MALSDPQTITIDTVAKTCALIEATGLRSKYATSDGVVNFQVSHQASKGRIRRMARVDQKVIAADPLLSVNEYKNLGVYLVVDQPDFGFTDAEIYDVAAGLIAWLSEANVLKILGSEH